MACDRWGFNHAMLVISITTASLCLFSLSLYETKSIEQSQTAEIRPLLAENDHEDVTTKDKEEASDDVAPSSTTTVDSTEGDEKANESIWELFRLAFETPYRAAFITCFFFLNLGMSVIENMIFLFYQTKLGGPPTM